MKNLLVTTFLLLPTLALAASGNAGTNNYLRSLGYSAEQLSAHVATEDREPFETAEGPGSVADPLGDVVSRWGEMSGIHNAWGDISDMTLTKNDADQTWDFVFTVGDSVPAKLSETENAQWFVYVDADGDISNNATEGIRIGTDAEFSVQYDQGHGWYTDFRWYNKSADFWAINKETASTFAMNANSLSLRVPFAEVPAAQAPHWRTALAITDGGAMQIDVVPGIGFPPPKGETYPTAASPSKGPDASDVWVAGIAAAALIGYAVFRRVAKKRRA